MNAAIKFPMQTKTQLPRKVLLAIEDFQAYVRASYRTDLRKWPAARELIHRVADTINNYIDSPGRAVNTENVAALLMVNVHFESGVSALKGCGRLTVSSQGFRATVFGSQHENRARFTFAHECGHSLFFSRRSEPYERILPATNIFTSTLRQREEGLCDEFARSLLVPSVFREDLLQFEGRTGDLLFIARDFNVAPSVIFRRVAHDFGGWDDLAFYGIHRSGNTWRVKLYRGLKNRSNKTVATGPEIEKTLLGARSMNQAARILFDTYGFPPTEVVSIGSSLWCSIKIAKAES